MLYYFPSLLCALLNIGASIFCWKLYVRQKNQLTIPFFLLLCVSLVTNCILSALSYSPTYQTLIFLKLYYFSLILCLLALNAFIYSITNQHKHILTGLNILALVLSFQIIWGDSIIAGVRLVNEAFTRVEGNLYHALQLYLLLGLSFAIVQLVTHLRRPGLDLQREQAACAAIFIGFIPLFVLSVYTIILMFCNVDVHALIILPIGFTFLLLACSYPMMFKRIINFSLFLPFTSNWRIQRQIRLLLYTHQDGIDLREKLVRYERALVDVALKQAKGDIRSAARILGVSYASYYYKLHAKRDG